MESNQEKGHHKDGGNGHAVKSAYGSRRLGLTNEDG
jgi:hypothetical protein